MREVKDHEEWRGKGGVLGRDSEEKGKEQSRLSPREVEYFDH
jgi:hypothetical protein